MGELFKQAGQVVGTIGRASQMILLGVPIPGFLILCELIWIYETQLGSFVGPSASLQALVGVVDTASAFLSKHNGVVTAFLVLLVVCAAYCIGYLNRTLAFAVSDTLLRWNGYRATDLQRLTSRIAAIYGPDQVESVLGRYPIFGLAARDRWDVPMPATLVRGFCQMWLRRNAPDLVVDYAEAEINLTLGLSLPTFLLSAPFWLLLWRSDVTAPLMWTIASGPAIAAVALLYRIQRLRCVEVEHTITHFVVAHSDGWKTPGEESQASSEPGSKYSKLLLALVSVIALCVGAGRILSSRWRSMRRI